MSFQIGHITIVAERTDFIHVSKLSNFEGASTHEVDESFAS